MERCPEPNFHQVAVDLEKSRTETAKVFGEIRAEMLEIHGNMQAELATGTQIMRSLKASIDASTNRFDKVLEKYEAALKSQEDRVSKLERKVWYASGATGTVTFLLGIFWRYLPFLR